MTYDYKAQLHSVQLNIRKLQAELGLPSLTLEERIVEAKNKKAMKEQLAAQTKQSRKIPKWKV
jgi:hypothetical protein